NLGYTSKSNNLNLRHLPDELLPCLFISNNADIYIIADRDEGVITATDCQKNQKITLPEDKSLRGTAYTFYEQPEEVKPRGSWLSNVLQRFHSFIYWLMGLGFLTTMLSLSSFIFLMAIYNEVVPSRSEITLGYFVLGLILALCCIQFVH